MLISSLVGSLNVDASFTNAGINGMVITYMISESRGQASRALSTSLLQLSSITQPQH